MNPLVLAQRLLLALPTLFGVALVVFVAVEVEKWLRPRA